MNVNEHNDFFESKPVKQLLAEAYAAGYIFLRYNDIEFDDTDVTDSMYRKDEKCFVEYKYVQRACQFIDDVVNDRFDLHTLDMCQFALLYEHFVEKHKYVSLLCKINAYYDDIIMSKTFYVLPDYFTFMPRQRYYLDEMNAEEAYGKLCEVIEIAKTYTLLRKSGAEQVFQSKLKKVANERKMLKELNAK